MTKDERVANKAFWVERIADFQESGLSVPQWCAIQGIKIHRLRYWLKKLKTSVPDQTAIHWMSVNLDDADPALAVRVGPAVIEVRTGFDPQLLIAVVRSLSVL